MSELTASARRCRCGHERRSHTPERTGPWLAILGPNGKGVCRVCTCNKFTAEERAVPDGREEGR